MKHRLGTETTGFLAVKNVDFLLENDYDPILVPLIFLMGQMMVSSMGLSKNGWFTYLRSIEARPGFAPSLEATTGPERQMP